MRMLPTILFSIPAQVFYYPLGPNHHEHSTNSENNPPLLQSGGIPGNRWGKTRMLLVLYTALIHSTGLWHQPVPFTIHSMSQYYSIGNYTKWLYWNMCFSRHYHRKSSFCSTHQLILPIMLPSHRFLGCLFSLVLVTFPVSLHLQTVTSMHTINFRFLININFSFQNWSETTDSNLMEMHATGSKASTAGSLS